MVRIFPEDVDNQYKEKYTNQGYTQEQYYQGMISSTLITYYLIFLSDHLENPRAPYTCNGMILIVDSHAKLI